MNLYPRFVEAKVAAALLDTPVVCMPACRTKTIMAIHLRQKVIPQSTALPPAKVLTGFCSCKTGIQAVHGPTRSLGWLLQSLIHHAWIFSPYIIAVGQLINH